MSGLMLNIDRRKHDENVHELCHSFDLSREPRFLLLKEHRLTLDFSSFATDMESAGLYTAGLHQT